jgi:hypothetical protein
VAKDVKEDGHDGQRTRRLMPKARALLTASTAVMPADGAHWEARLHLEKQCAGAEEVRGVLLAQLAAYRQHTPWTSDADALDALSEVAAQVRPPRR